MQLYFIRHGESVANANNEISTGGNSNPLTERGVSQVEALAESLKEVSVYQMFSSPTLRASQTADILAKSLGLEYTTIEALREFNSGVLEGKSDKISWVALNDIWDDWMLNKNWSRRFEGGDSYEDVKNRFVPFVESIVAEHKTTDHNIFFVAHGGMYRSVLPIVLGNISHDFAYHNTIPKAGYVYVEFTNDELICRQWGDVMLS